MTGKFDNSNNRRDSGGLIMQDDIMHGSTRVHSLNSLLKDQSFNSIRGFKGILRKSSKYSNYWNDSSILFSADARDTLVKVEEREESDEEEDKEDIKPKRKSQYFDIFSKEPTKYSKQSALKTNPKGKSNDVRNLQNSKKFTNSLQDIGKPHLTNLKVLSKADLESRRIIILKGLPKGSNPGAVLTRVCGGPLERVVFHENREEFVMELYYAFPKDAHKFFEFGRTGLLLFNNQRLILEWANETNTENINLVHPPVGDSLLNQIFNGARRSLLFVREIPNKSSRHHHLHYPVPEQHYSREFDIKSVIKDFSLVGNIIDFSPIISRKLAFVLYFDDIRTAITVKKLCETKGSILNKKYRDWKLYYGKDITDKPCHTI
ncbi:sporulation-specific protein 2 [[Candida] jaroonii]|uniref:Sporulation-specific protein 2 n=1 Tax=[Candida] jaroonii TaxID=467808 RepID=A0ACA9YB67_9ASCO|nr:sporulation-specific protein 2 [[Candida] jaroonii]